MEAGTVAVGLVTDVAVIGKKICVFKSQNIFFCIPDFELFQVLTTF